MNSNIFFKYLKKGLKSFNTIKYGVKIQNNLGFQNKNKKKCKHQKMDLFVKYLINYLLI